MLDVVSRNFELTIDRDGRKEVMKGRDLSILSSLF